MSLPVGFLWRAQEELGEAATWYERQRPGLGQRFRDHVGEVLDRVSRTPEIHGRVYGDVRCAKVPRFPYGIYYRIEPNRVVVISVFHGKRDPREWQSRV